VFSALGVAVFVLPLWVFFGRAFFGAPLGIQFLAQFVLVPLLFVGQLVGTLIVFFRPSVRRTRAVSWIDAGLFFLLWVGQLGIGFFLVDNSATAVRGASAFSALVGDQALGLSTGLSAASIALTIVAGAALVVFAIWQAVREARENFRRTLADMESAASRVTGQATPRTPDFASDPDRVIRISPRA
jgi:hypothetical protein